MESLTDLRWDPRLAVEKSRNSSTHEGFVAKEGSFACETTSGQLGTVMFGIFGGNCAITKEEEEEEFNLNPEIIINLQIDPTIPLEEGLRRRRSK